MSRQNRFMITGARQFRSRIGMVPDIITNARAAIFRAMAGEIVCIGIWLNSRPLCINQKVSHSFIDPDFMRSYVVR